MRLLFCLFLSTTFFVPVFAQQSLESPFGKAPLQKGFLKNSGQVRDLQNKRVDFVYYQANIGDQQLFITKYGLSLLLSRPISMKRVASVYPGVTLPSKVSSSDSSCIVNYEMERIDIVLKGSSILPGNIVTKTNQQSPEYNLYFDRYETGGQGLHLQNEILVKNIYPGIDWKVYIKEEDGKQASVKYDFIVHPGANPSLIKLRYSDNAKVELSGAGIKAVTKMGEVKEEKPYSYLEENRSTVEVVYSIKKNTVSFDAGNYDRHNTLVIDPSIFWLTYLSTTNHTGQYLYIFGNDVETDAAGNIFVQLSAAANTPFPTINPGGGAYYQDVTASPNGAMILVKFSPGGQMLWSTYFGNSVGGRTMTIDKFGNICTVGIVLDGVPNTNPSIPLLNNGGFYIGTLEKYFISKFSNSGQLTWSSYYVNFSSYPIDMSYDINGNIYVAGWSQVYDFPVANPGGGAYVVTNPQYGYAQVLFISQFNSSNQLIWSTRIEGNDYDPQVRVCADKLGNIYIAGDARSGNYPLLNAGGYFLNSGNSVITRFNPARQITWSTRFPSSFTMGDLTTDDNNNLYIGADNRIVKFDINTQQVFQKSVPTTRMHFWKRIGYDPVHDQIQLLGIMNDFYYDFPTINTPCNGSFFKDGISPFTYLSATGPLFATMTRDGIFSYLSLVDWVSEYYQYFEMTIDGNGDPIYIFGDNKNGFNYPNPQLTNPGNGAYFDNFCAPGGSALLLKLTASESLLVTTQVTPANGCSCDASATATVQCGTAPYTYLWSNGSTNVTATGLCPGASWVKVTDANNISKTVTVSIPYPPGSVTSIIAAVVPENCNKANARITVQTIQGGTSPFSYSLNGITYQPAGQFSGLSSGNYMLRVKDANGCVYNDTVIVPNIGGPSNILFTVKKRSCVADDGQIDVTGVLGGVGPFKYILNGAVTITNTTGVFSNLPAGTYQLQAADTAGCTVIKTIVVDQANPPTGAVYTTSNDHCNMAIGLIQPGNVIGGQSPYSFSVDSISFIPGTINNLNAGNYNLYIRDVNGCVLKKSPVVVVNEAGPSAVNFNINHAYCGKLTGDITVNTVQGNTPPYVYAVDNSVYQSSATFSALQPGNHTLYVKDNYGCIYTQACEIKFKPALKINLLPADTTVCYDEQLILKLAGNVNQAKNITWNITSQGNSALIKATEEKRVIVNILDSNNCATTVTGVIKVKACNTPAKCIEIPAAFTPNKDGINDKLGPLVNGCRVESIYFQVFNRYGELVFETQKTGEGWDGFYKGLAQPEGAYTYFCSYIIEGAHLQKKGSFILIR